MADVEQTTVLETDSMTITHLGTACVLIEIGGLRILTDPVFDEPSEYYSFGWGLGSTKVGEVKIQKESLGHIDAILLSHDEHADNLDKKGREFLPSAGKVLTTASGSKRLSTHDHLTNSIGLNPWDSHELASKDGKTVVKVTATPARHGPPLSSIIVGDVIGFVLEWSGQKNGAVYITGDTVYYSELLEVGKKFQIGTGIFHLGSVQFTLSGPIKYTMNAEDGIALAKDLKVKKFLPIHYEGWTHFKEGKEGVQKALEGHEEVKSIVQWLDLGVPAVVTV